MKINSVKTNTGYLNTGRTMQGSLRNERECAKERVNLKQQLNKDQINTTIEKNSDGRVSFKGAPFLHTAANYVMQNPIVAEAMFAILITCGLRPLTIMATARTPEDKEKCGYQVGKSISTGVVGLGMSALVATPLSKAIKNVQKSGALDMPEAQREALKKTVSEGVESLGKYAKTIAKQKDVDEIHKGFLKDLIKDDKLHLDVLKGFSKKGRKAMFENTLEKVDPKAFKKYADAVVAQKQLSNYSGTAKNILDKLLQPAFLPFRAAVTIALVPIITNALGLKKGGSKKPKEAEAKVKTPEVKQNASNPYNSLTYLSGGEKGVFSYFTEENKNANK